MTERPQKLKTPEVLKPLAGVAEPKTHGSITTMISQKPSAQSISTQDFQTVAKPVESYLKKPTWLVTVGVDTEYVQRLNRPNMMLTTQLAFGNSCEDCVILEHPELNRGILPSWNGRCILSTVLRLSETDDLSDPDGYLIFEPMMFFAPADLLAGLFSSEADRVYIEGFCTQDARIRLESGDKRNPDKLLLPLCLETPYGKLRLVLKVTDLAKVSVGTLKETAEGLGLQMPAKDAMDKYKTNMLEPYSSPSLLEEYLRYAASDASILWDIREANRKRTEILYGIHNLTTPEREVLTTGSLVASLFQEYLTNYVGDYKTWELFSSIGADNKARPWGLTDLTSRSTVEYFATLKETRKSVAAIVQGGRAKNERPTVIKVSGVVADYDAAGAYVTMQRLMLYPLGLPATYGQHRSSNRVMTLGDFLKKNGSELYPRTWFIVLNGKLGHNQTLVTSKTIDSLEVTLKFDPEDPKIDADFRLYTKEVINGILTSDVWETLQNICTNQEVADWKALEVTAAVWYPASNICHTPQEWFEKTSSHIEKYGNSVETKVSKHGKELVIDNRSRFWLAVPLEGFLKPYQEKRNELKSAMKAEKSKPEALQDKELIASLDAQQNAMKLVGNTNYGVQASPFFEISNIVVANNITAMMRTVVWCTAMATGAFGSITDGGGYDLNAVRFWDIAKPGMETLSLWRNPERISRKRLRGLSTAPLASETLWTVEATGEKNETRLSNGVVTVTAKESGWKILDEAIASHTQNFFRVTDGKPEIELLSKVKYEHKDIYQAAVFHSQTNYQFHHVDGSHKNKARGHKLKDTPYNGGTEAANILKLFNDLWNNAQTVPPYRPQTIGQVLKCNQARAMRKSAVDNALKTYGLVAGDTVEKRSHIRPLSLSMFHWQTDKQYRAWEKAHNKLKEVRGYGVEGFFINPDGLTINYQKAVETIQALIDDGQDWVLPKTQNQDRFNHAVDHPYLA